MMEYKFFQQIKKKAVGIPACDPKSKVNEVMEQNPSKKTEIESGKGMDVK